MTYGVLFYWITAQRPFKLVELQEIDKYSTEADVEILENVELAKNIYKEFQSEYIKLFTMTEVQKISDMFDCDLELVDYGEYKLDRIEPMTFNAQNSCATMYIGISAENQFKYYLNRIAQRDFSVLGDLKNVYCEIDAIPTSYLLNDLHNDWSSKDIWGGTMLSNLNWPVKVSFNLDVDDWSDNDLSLVYSLKDLRNNGKITYPIKLEIGSINNIVDIDDFKL